MLCLSAGTTSVPFWSLSRCKLLVRCLFPHWIFHFTNRAPCAQSGFCLIGAIHEWPLQDTKIGDGLRRETRNADLHLKGTEPLWSSRLLRCLCQRDCVRLPFRMGRQRRRDESFVYERFQEAPVFDGKARGPELFF